MIFNAKATNHRTYNSQASIAGKVVLTVIILGLAWKFVLMPKYEEQKQKTSDLDQLQTILDQTNEENRQIKQLESKLAKAKPEIDALKNAIPSDRRLSRVYVLVENFATSVGLNVTNISVEEDTRSISGAESASASKVQGIEQIGIKLTLTGNIQSLRALLAGFESAPRLFELDSVSISSGDKGVSNFSVNLYTYIYTPNKK